MWKGFVTTFSPLEFPNQVKNTVPGSEMLCSMGIKLLSFLAYNTHPFPQRLETGVCTIDEKYSRSRCCYILAVFEKQNLQQSTGSRAKSRLPSLPAVTQLLATRKYLCFFILPSRNKVRIIFQGVLLMSKYGIWLSRRIGVRGNSYLCSSPDDFARRCTMYAFTEIKEGLQGTLEII